MDKKQIREELISIITPFVPEAEGIDFSKNQDLINDLKINSAHIVDIVLDLEDKFDIMIEDDVIGQMNTLDDVVEAVDSKINS